METVQRMDPLPVCDPRGWKDFRGRAPSELDGGDRLPPDPESADVTDLAKLL